eukprot:scaffold46502_cov21-Tisochrysis_lutea.AAC.1
MDLWLKIHPSAYKPEAGAAYIHFHWYPSLGEVRISGTRNSHSTSSTSNAITQPAMDSNGSNAVMPPAADSNRASEDQEGQYKSKSGRCCPKHSWHSESAHQTYAFNMLQALWLLPAAAEAQHQTHTFEGQSFPASPCGSSGVALWGAAARSCWAWAARSGSAKSGTTESGTARRWVHGEEMHTHFKRNPYNSPRQSWSRRASTCSRPPAHISCTPSKGVGARACMDVGVVIMGVGKRMRLQACMVNVGGVVGGSSKEQLSQGGKEVGARAWMDVGVVIVSVGKRMRRQALWGAPSRS